MLARDPSARVVSSILVLGDRSNRLPPQTREDDRTLRKWVPGGVVAPKEGSDCNRSGTAVGRGPENFRAGAVLLSVAVFCCNDDGALTVTYASSFGSNQMGWQVTVVTDSLPEADGVQSVVFGDMLTAGVSIALNATDDCCDAVVDSCAKLLRSDF